MRKDSWGNNMEPDRRNRDLTDAYLRMARTMVSALETRDLYIHGHSRRVSRLAVSVGLKLGIAAEDCRRLELAGRLHDIGKTGLPDTILLKPGTFEPPERAEMQRHPTRGVEILRFLNFLEDIWPLIESHHEWCNGTGYPNGLHREEIPLGGRILAVADAYDAMISKRPYRPALSCQEAMRRLKEGAATQWDAEVVDAFLSSIVGPHR
jgi:putative nucleotidyltransferase with HDIG domain